eukprot:CAMPEP_0201574292 /NCGR_PEP_ID=MMETSP0190_2-20130828/18696_1 /ASSEMBLY_ACC=CAM_ASM_000263 /TAXON_ID=37353 /ORGANISM="Rosalina sp." /LENGTH=573 /DNA_ID=CAMNT_0048002345 /DNA_START=119 /DNA_END=1840 /DNA_ORIENTATION=+
MQRRFSQVLREQWSHVYTEKIRKQGEADLETAVKFGKIEDFDIAQHKTIQSNECIILFPKIEKKTGDEMDYTEDTKDNDDIISPSRMGTNGNGKITKSEYTAYRLPLLYPTVGFPCIDVRALKGKTGVTTYDPGFLSTCSCHSTITYIDGPNGRLLHRGYEIQELCEKSDFVDLSFLLLYGELPGKNDRIHHETQIKKHSLVHEKLIEFYKGFRYNAHPMAIMCAVVGALSSFYHDEMDIHNLDHRLLSAYRIIAKMPTLAAMAYKTSIGQPIVYPKNSLSFAENFLYMMFSIPAEEYVINPIKAKALDKFLMLHADHEQNASTSTVRIAGSSHANPFACIASGITTLWGPAHGGANEAVLNMLGEIGSAENIPKYIAKAKDKKDPFRLMGFGHRVYKNYDPRAKVMQKICHELLEELQIKNEPLLDLAMELEKIALKDEYFIKRRLFPNVDFYSGIVLKALGIPRSMYTVLFAVGRTIGWISHWKEMIEDPKQRIGRPRQLYMGKGPRKYVNVDDRTDQHESLMGSYGKKKVDNDNNDNNDNNNTKTKKRGSVVLLKGINENGTAATNDDKK